MKFSFTTLGTSSASPMPDRYQSAHILRICGHLFLVDCGDGCQYLLKRHHISIIKLDAIFISHTHGDHVLGLPGLLNTMSMKRRKADLNIYGPESLRPILDFYKENFTVKEYFKVIFHPVVPSEPIVFYEDEDMEISAFPLRHGITANGYIFREKDSAGRSFAYISDTVYFEDLSQIVKGTGLIYSESTFGDALVKKADRMYHCTARQAATVASEAGAGKLILGHFSSVYADPSVLLPEAIEVFPETYIAKEGMEFDVPSLL